MVRLCDAPSDQKNLFALVVCVGGEQALLDQKFTKLKNWVIENGGFVHDSLRLQKFEKPPYLFVMLSVHPSGSDRLWMKDIACAVPS